MKLKTINIHGKNYVEVNERIKYFRENYKGWSLTSELIDLTENRCVIKASITDEKDKVIATGIAYEVMGSSYINKTSFIENCETSAWGRALGNLGIGIDTSIASAFEVNNAIIAGSFDGSLTVNEVLYLESSAVIKGKISYNAISNNGAKIIGVIEPIK